MIEKDFVTEGLKRTKIDEYLESKLERAGYGGMKVQVSPLGTMIVVFAERPGMVIGRGGKTVRGITQTLKNNFDLDNPQVEVKEVDVPELNPKIMAHKIASMLQRGMHFRRVAYSNIRRIMAAGAQGVEVTISGKIRGSRSATAKFIEGYIKKCGEPSTRLVKEGFSTVQLKPGVLGVFVRIMPPDAELPDKVEILPPKPGDVPEPTEEESVKEVSAEGTELQDEEIEEIESQEEIEDIEELVASDDDDFEEVEEIEDIDDIEEIEDVEESEDSQDSASQDSTASDDGEIVELEESDDIEELEADSNNESSNDEDSNNDEASNEETSQSND